MIGPAVDNRASHQKYLACSKRVFDYVQRLIEELVQLFTVRLEQLRDKNTRVRRVRFPARSRAATRRAASQQRDRDADE